MKTNLLIRRITENSFKINNLSDHVFDIKLVPIPVSIGTFPNAEEVFFRQLNKAVRLISSKISGPAGLIWKDGIPHAAVPADAAFDAFIAYLKPVRVTLQLQPEVYQARFNKCSEQTFEIIKKLLDFSIRKQIKRCGYLIEEATGRFFYKSPLPGFENNSIDLLHGFIFRLVPDGRDKLSICLDITYRYVDKNPFSEFISQKGIEFVKKQLSDKRPNPKIGIRFLYEMGDWTFPIEVFSISDKTVEEEIVLDQQTNEHISLYDYLLKKTNKHENKLAQLSREDRVVYYKYPGKEMDYYSAPASLIRQIYKPDDTKVGKLHSATIKEINERFKFIRVRVRDEFQRLSFNGKPLTLEPEPEVLTLQAFPLKDLKYNGNKLVTGSVTENGRVRINKDYAKQRKSLLQSVGVLKRGTIDDTQYLLVPDTLNFPKGLQTVFKKYFEDKTGKLCPEFIGFKKVIYYRANKDSAKDLEDEVAYALEKESVTEGYALIILPYWGKDDYKINLFHDFIKNRFKGKINFQCADSDKIQNYFERSGQDKFVFADEEQAKKFNPYLFNLALEYLKLNERYPFALNNSPNYDIYIGIDVHQQCIGFSFFYRKGEVIKLERKEIPKPPSKTRDEKIKEKDIYDIIYPILKRHIPRYCTNPNAIIIGRDGCSHDEKHALVKTIQQLAKDGIITNPQLPCAVFDLHKQSQIPYRVGEYDVNHGQYRTPMAGTYRLFGRDKEQAFLFSTGFPFQIRGSAKPLHFTLAFQQGDIIFEKILEDMFGQCLLAFSAPDKPNRLPVMFKLLDDYLEPFGVSQRKLDEVEKITEEDEEVDEDHVDAWDENTSRYIDPQL